jgi:septum formation protein
VLRVVPADADETPLPGEQPAAYVERVARCKADLVAPAHTGAWVLAADTAVVVDGEILGKPRDAADAHRMLARLSGRAHTVMTAIALAGQRVDGSRVETGVIFRRLGPAEIAWYVSTGEPLDKAGAYALQGAGGAFVTRVEGSVSNVVGLPLAETLEMLSRAGFPLPGVGES